MKKKNNKGMTIVECVVAFAIITIVSLMAVSGFLASAAFVRRGIDLKSAGDAASLRAESENAADVSDPSCTLTIVTPSGTKSIGGKVYTAEETVNDVTVEFSLFDRS